MEDVQAGPLERDDKQIAAAAKATNSTAVRRRRMGEVYPIMKNTIYSDEECEEVVVLTSWDCGMRFIRYISGLFQYFVRNPKAMGFFITTAIILLFFKYAQQVVVKAVNAAVRAHPGLEPTDTIRSAVTSFTEELRALERAAQTIGWAYMRDSVKGYDIGTAAGTTFSSLVRNFQLSFIANMKTYVVYTFPAAASTALTSRRWGQIGCASNETNSSICFYVSNDSTVRQWDTVSNTGDGGPLVSRAYIEQCMPDLLSVATAATKGSALATSGVWTRPYMACNIFPQKTVRTISYLLPIAFNAEGYATVMAGIDVSLELLMEIVNAMATPNIELVVVDNRHNASRGGQFVYDSFDKSIFWTTPYGVLDAPVGRIRDLAESVWSEHGGTLAVNGSFYQNGLIYQSLTMMSHWTLIASSPLVLSVAEVAATLGVIVKESKGIATVASGLYQDCESAANMQQNSVTVEALGEMEQAFGTHLHSLYTSYTLAGTTKQRSSSASAVSESSKNSNADSESVTHVLPYSSTWARSSAVSSAAKATLATPAASTRRGGSGMEMLVLQAATGRLPVDSLGISAAWRTSSGGSAAKDERVWGVCGCTFTSVTNKTCFFTDSSQTEILFEGSVFNASAKDKIEMSPSSASFYGLFTSQHIDSTTTTTGFWTKPYLRSSASGNASVAVSYVHPSEHDRNGYVMRATIIEINAAWMAYTLKANQHNGTTALYLIDRRGAGTFLASSTAVQVTDAVYTALKTPHQEFNRIASAVYSTAGNTWERSLSFHMETTLVNYQVVEGQWGIVEVIPGDVALQRYLPTPAVTSATDALRLLPPGETVQLFLYLGSILFFFFLNLLILGCSHLGRQ
ncbi:hypothetical protein, unknown function [Leishmania mexicana MHOM/GT/2001/U1103]|uniref:Uncharacterized protein n=1 Tax=Leishmania mexicana (strain MHOM/GT/2001/U1103) TaxID=929439 RepID=E9ATA3_LEIMU|nr:hypothetical protein, unknown function [Leishmania mexicana MHOM/GT/2001/U1103]CBZ26177.1 hypothetical protein, unknown function [Leishmania mexicana MHOM/GT/2001/U1103]